jgi:uncharacterized membrane protein (DUF373 family)
VTRHHDEDHAPHATKIVALAFETSERWITIGIGAILIFATLLLLTGSIAEVWQGLKQWPDTDAIFLIVDKLLFVLMLVEILHTVRASIDAKRLAVEPFLIVGLIATVRRMLIVTVESSTSASFPKEPFEHVVIELGVLGGLTLILIVSIYLARHSRRLLTETEQAQLAHRDPDHTPDAGSR